MKLTIFRKSQNDINDTPDGEMDAEDRTANSKFDNLVVTTFRSHFGKQKKHIVNSEKRLEKWEREKENKVKCN